MRPILLSGHVRSSSYLSIIHTPQRLTLAAGESSDPSQVRTPNWFFKRDGQNTPTNNQRRFSKEGDFIFSVSKDHNACGWWAHNGERFGVYKGHQGALWTVDVDPRTVLLATGGADNTIRLWEVKTGKLLKTWEFGTAIKRVEFNEDGSLLLGVTEKRQGQLSTIIVYDINQDPEGEQPNEESLRIVVDDIPKVTVAGFSACSRYIISGHEDGSVTQWDAKTGEEYERAYPHEDGMMVTDLQWSSDRTYFVTSSKDKTAKVLFLSMLQRSQQAVTNSHTHSSWTPRRSKS
jgi:translation initiation factor 3 subunit I